LQSYIEFNVNLDVDSQTYIEFNVITSNLHQTYIYGL
jgi:hypothetical protein